MKAQQSDELFRSWNHSHNSKMDSEVLRLEEEAHKTRMKIQQLRAKGKKTRLHRIEALDALEMKKMTLVEILKRMDKELKEKDVYSYGVILAKVVGERNKDNHKARCLEALLIQLMHQMLTKQHQLKIMKQSAKKTQQMYKQHKIRNKDEFHSYDALAVQLEAARLSLEAMYDDIFAHQHRIFAKVNNLNTEGKTTNYTIPTPTHRNTKPMLSVSTKHKVLPDEMLSPDSVADFEQDDFETAVNLLYHSDEDNIIVTPTLKRDSTKSLSKTETSPNKSPNKSPNTKSARERRREIEQMRKAWKSLSTSTINSNNITSMEEEQDVKSHRQRMRELEAVRKKLSVKTPILNFENTETNVEEEKKGEATDFLEDVALSPLKSKDTRPRMSIEST